MKHYVQIKDGVVFATISTEKELETSDTVIEVNTDPEQYIHKAYDGESFVDADIYRYAILDEENTIIDIRKTYFISEAEKDNGILITNSNAKILWKWNGKHGVEKEFIAPIEVSTLPVVVENSPEN